MFGLIIYFVFFLYKQFAYISELILTIISSLELKTFMLGG